MKAYVDSSAVLRIVLGAPNAIEEWDDIEQFVTSDILRVECFRTIDRLRIVDRLSDEEVSYRHESLHAVMRRMDFVEIDLALLERASESFPLPVKTLDALHLVSAVSWRDNTRGNLFATHDRSLALAARAMDFRVIGV